MGYSNTSPKNFNQPLNFNHKMNYSLPGETKVLQQVRIFYQNL